MYEYIQNTILESSLKPFIITICYVFFFTNSLISYADVYYFQRIYHKYDYQDADTDEEPPSHPQLQPQPQPQNTDVDNSVIEPGEIGNIGWEYEFEDCFTTLSDYFLSFFWKKEKKEPPKQVETKKEPVTVAYTDKYKDLWKKKSPNFRTKEQVDLDTMKNNVLFENTPFGNVIMYYDVDKKSFIYYSDKTLSYPIVNTVGRKYVLTFGCEFLYVNELGGSSNEQKQKEEEDNNPSLGSTNNVTSFGEETPSKKNVYAKLKNYKNPPTKSNSSGVTNKKEEKKEEEINRYTCEGKLANFSLLKKIPKIKKFSYKDFKNKFKISQ